MTAAPKITEQMYGPFKNPTTIEQWEDISCNDRFNRIIKSLTSNRTDLNRVDPILSISEKFIIFKIYLWYPFKQRYYGDETNIILIRKVDKTEIPTYLEKIDTMFYFPVTRIDKDGKKFTIYITNEDYEVYCFNKEAGDCLKFAEQVSSKKYKGIGTFIDIPKSGDSIESCIFQIGDKTENLFGCSTEIEEYKKEKEFAEQYIGPSNEDANPEPGEAFAIVDLDEHANAIKMSKTNLLIFLKDYKRNMNYFTYSDEEKKFNNDMIDILEQVIPKIKDKIKKEKDGTDIKIEIPIHLFDLIKKYLDPYLVKNTNIYSYPPTDEKKEQQEALYSIIETIYGKYLDYKKITDTGSLDMFHYHIGAVVFKDGIDRITLERCGKQIVFPQFHLYYKDDKEDKSFHRAWKHVYGKPKTVVLKPRKTIEKKEDTKSPDKKKGVKRGREEVSSGAAASGTGRRVTRSMTRTIRSRQIVDRHGAGAAASGGKSKTKKKKHSKRNKKQRKTRSKRKRANKKTRSKK